MIAYHLRETPRERNDHFAVGCFPSEILVLLLFKFRVDVLLTSKNYIPELILSSRIFFPNFAMFIVRMLVSIFIVFPINFYIVLANFDDVSISPANEIDWKLFRGTAEQNEENSTDDPTVNLRRFIYSLPNEEETEKNKYVYLNYKKAYGIRYNPSDTDKPNVVDNKRARKCNQTYQTKPPIGVFETDLTTVTPSTMTTTTDSVILSETTTVPTTTSTSEPETSTFSANVETISTSSRPYRRRASLKNTTPIVVDQPFSHVPTTPPQRGFFQSMWDYIGDKFKRFFNYGLEISLPLPAQHGGPRFLNLFNVIKFENTPCTSSETMLSEMTGTCYNDDECRDMGGVPIDKCADGFGVCCACE